MLDYRSYLNDDELITVEYALKYIIWELQNDINTDDDAKWLDELQSTLAKVQTMQSE